YGRSRARTSSGSACSEAAVKPTRSQKSTETTLRSSRRAAGAASLNGTPQNGQNGNSPGSSLPQFGHVATQRVSPKAGRSRVAVERVTTGGGRVRTLRGDPQAGIHGCRSAGSNRGSNPDGHTRSRAVGVGSRAALP